MSVSFIRKRVMYFVMSFLLLPCPLLFRAFICNILKKLKLPEINVFNFMKLPSLLHRTGSSVNCVLIEIVPRVYCMER